MGFCGSGGSPRRGGGRSREKPKQVWPPSYSESVEVRQPQVVQGFLGTGAWGLGTVRFYNRGTNNTRSRMTGEGAAFPRDSFLLQ